MRRTDVLAALAAGSLAPAALAGPSFEAHDVTLRALPGEGRIEATDRADVRRDGGGTLAFRLAPGLEVTAVRVDGREARAVAERAETGPVSWTVAIPAGPGERARVEISWSGAPRSRGARVGPAGVLLAAGTDWMPADGAPARHTVRFGAVAGWTSVADGTRSAGSGPGDPEVWTTDAGAVGISVAAGPWAVGRARAAGVEVEARSGDAGRAETLAARAAAEAGRLAALLGPRRTGRLDLVELEDAAECGGAGFVAVDPKTADRLVASDGAALATLRRATGCIWFGAAGSPPATGSRGRDAIPWRDALGAYVAEDLDAPPADPAAVARRRRAAALTIAGGASHETSVARGTAFLHALRREVGDAAFRETLRRVAAESRPAPLDWGAWQREFERTARRGLADAFAQGLDRPGAPVLELGTPRTRAESGRYLVSGTLRQRLAAGEAPWRLTVPVVVEHLEGRDEVLVDLTGPETGFSIPVPSMPLRVAADPDHHVLRAADDPPPAVPRTSRFLLPDLRAATSPDRAKAVLSRLTTPPAAGTVAEVAASAARRIAMDELRTAGVEPEERSFAFSVKALDGTRPVLARADGTTVEGVVPLIASPETPAGGVPVVGAVGDDDPDLAGRALVVDLSPGAARPIELLRAVARLAASRRAAAVFVRRPAAPGSAADELWDFPESAEAGTHNEALRRAATAAARTGSDVEFPLPVVAVPAGFRAAKDEFLRLDVRFARTELRSANVVGRIRAGGGGRGGPLVLAAPLGPAGDDAARSGAAAAVTAVLEAVQALAAQPDLGARDVEVVLLGAEEWGLRGSRAYAASVPADRPPVAVVLCGPVGRGDAPGLSIAPADGRLARTLGAAARECALDVAPGDSSPATAPFAARGIAAAAVDAAGAPAGPVPPADPSLVARVGRALALAALAVSGGW